LLLGILEHVVTRWLLKGEREDILKCHEQVSDLVLNGVCGQAGGDGGAAARRRIPGKGDKRRNRS
jgi:hypothetical protein